VGYEGKELFDRNAVERIALYSMGIPRLINVICDNALLFAYADSKNKVSAEIIERVACSLQLMLPSRFQIPPDTDLRRSNNRPEETINETKPAEFEMAEAPDEFHSRRSPAGRGLGMLLALLLVASGSALLYSQQMRNYFWDVAVGVPDFIEKQVETFKPGRLMSKISETGSSSGALSTNGNASPEVDRIPASQHAPHGRAPRLSDSNDVHRAAPKKLPVKQDRTDDVAPVAKGSEAAQPRLPPPGPRASVKEGPKPQRIEPQLHSARNESVRLAFQKNSEKERRFFVGTFEVTGDSLVYDKPQRRAAPVTTLQPGTWVRVENKIGDYLRVRSLNDPGVRGYMRLEEALLQRIG
jgi:hypothetical protein